jgi:hypothetical protein
VYLDTNVLSLLATARLKAPRLTKADARLGEEALDFFTRLVDSRVAIFPDSYPRQDEIQLKHDPQFQGAARKIAARLSRGVLFQPVTQILYSQIRNLFVAHLDGTEYTPTWQEAFTDDPRGPIPKSVEQNASCRWATGDEQRHERRRLLKQQFVEYHQDRAQRTATPLAPYNHLKAANAREYIEIVALGPLRRSRLGKTLDYGDIAALHATAGAIGIAHQRGDLLGVSFWPFANSQAILKVPAIDIWASIETSIELDERSRGWDLGDQYDLEALSDVLPYCDAVFCDRGMKGKLRRRGIASRYETAVYSLRDFDRFRRDVEAGPTGRLHAMDPRVAPIAERWDRVTDHLRIVVRICRADSWSEPSPYPGWTYKDLLAHLATGYTVRLAQLRGLLEKGELCPEPDADAANAENIARHRKSSPEALVEEMVRQRSEVRRLLGLLRPEHLETRTIVRRAGQPPRDGAFLEALQHWHEHDLEHASDLAPIMRWPVAPPDV